MQFNHRLYDRHINNWKIEQFDPERIKVQQTWFREDTVDFWRHERMYEAVFRCLASKKTSKWMTVGDGRYGLDAIRMLRRGFTSVLATDIAGNMLQAAREMRLLSDFSVENLESLSQTDDAFDYILCKETLHHLPRPYIGLYEMIRVAKHAVVIIEGQDQYIDQPVVAGKRTPAYEKEDGNYVYSFSRAEFEKVCYGMNLPAAAYKNISDMYVAGCENQIADVSNPFFREFVKAVLNHEEMCRQGTAKPSLLMTVIFKTLPSPETIESFVEAGWDYCNYPPNPYVT
jgi:ubiquinone/menaquinone biosynthesis C-methylase UbiE